MKNNELHCQLDNFAVLGGLWIKHQPEMKRPENSLVAI